MNKKRILVCAFACSPDGSSGLGAGEDILGWNMVIQIAKFYDVWVICSPKNKKSVESSLVDNGIKNIHFNYIDLPHIIAKPLEIIWSQGGSELYSYFWQVRIYFFAKKLHKKNNFDVFHHVTYANDWMASYIGALLPVPYIRGPGGGAHKVPKEFLSEFSVGDYFWQRIRGLGQWIFRHDPFFIMGQNKAKALLLCNNEAVKAVPKKYKEKISLFPVNGISYKNFEFRKINENFDSKIFNIISAGRLIEIKGFPLAIKAFRLFNNKFLETCLTIIGNGPDMSRLSKLVSELGLGEKVVFTGWLSHKATLSKIYSGDVFLFPSLRDGGGNVVVEAMAAGKPVVCFDLAGPGFHIDESCGIKIKPENPEQAIKDIAQALEKLYCDKNLRLKLGQGAGQKAEKEYDWDKLGDKLFEIYKKVL